MECRACRSSKLVLLIMLVIVSLLSYKAFFAPSISSPITELVEGDDSPQAQQQQIAAADINLMIQDYIVNHPEDIIRSLEVIQKKKLKAMQAEAEKVIHENIDSIENTDGVPVIGNKDGSVKITYFYDYNCNYCIKASEIFDQIVDTNPQVKLIYKPLPYLGDGSEYIARIILAINKEAPNKLKKLHNILLSSQINSAQEILELLNKEELDGAKIVKLAESAEIQKILQNNLELAKTINIKGVPVYVINGKYYAGVIRAGQIQDIINSLEDTKVEEK